MPQQTTPQRTVSNRLRVLGPLLGLAGLVAAAGASTACTRTVSTTIPHPMTAGLTVNEIPITYFSTERQRGLPQGTLSDTGQITQLDATTMCFAVRLSDIDSGQGTTWTALENFQISLDTDTAASELRVENPTLQNVQPVAQTYNGLNPIRVQTGERRRCVRENENGNCREWRREPIYETQYVPGPVNVVTGGGSICFGNQAFVTPETTRVELRLQRAGYTVTFEWNFT
ncbi:MAG: hypothetical protein AAGH15_06415 [Myxococcota bacterium]